MNVTFAKWFQSNSDEMFIDQDFKSRVDSNDYSGKGRSQSGWTSWVWSYGSLSVFTAEKFALDKSLSTLDFNQRWNHKVDNYHLIRKRWLNTASRHIFWQRSRCLGIFIFIPMLFIVCHKKEYWRMVRRSSFPCSCDLITLISRGTEKRIAIPWR